MAKMKNEKNIIEEISGTDTNADCVIENQDGVVVDGNVYMGVTPDYECMPTMSEEELEAMANADVSTTYIPYTVADVVSDLKDFIIKHRAIAEGNGYKAEYINYKSLVESLLRKLSQYEG